MAVEPPSQLVEYWRVIRTNIAAICIATVAGAALGWLFSVLRPPMYQARTVLDIQSLNEDFLNSHQGASVTSNNGGVLPEAYLQTEIKILQSDSLRKRALERIPVPPQARNLANTDEPVLWRSALNLVDPTTIPRKALLAEAARNVKIRALGNTRIVEMLCDARDGQLAADFCSSLAHTYIAYNLESRAQSTKETGDWLESQLEDVRKRLTRAESDLKDAAREAPFADGDNNENLPEEKLRQLQAQLSQAQADRVVKESDYETASSRPVDALPLAMDAGPLRDYRMRLTELRRLLAEKSATMTPDHYQIRELNNQIAVLEQATSKEASSLVNRLRADYEAAKRREDLINSAYQKQAAEVAQHGDKAVKYTMLKREVDTERKLYETLLQKVNEVGLAAAMRTSTISIVDPAVAPTAPYSPNRKLDMAVGMLGGTCIGLAFSFLRLRANRTLQTPGETPLVLRARELGVIPTVHRGGVQRFLYRKRPKPMKKLVDLLPEGGAPEERPDGSSLHPRLLKQLGPSSIALGAWLRNPPELAEAFSGTMSALLFATENGARARVVVLTSPEAGDGKTTAATNLAISLAQIGRRVAVMDGDLRRPRLHEIFGVEPHGGLAEILESEQPIEDWPLEDMLRETAVKGLSVLPTAPVRTGISSRLHSARMRTLLGRLRREFDMVIIDTPPMLNLADARVLGWLADGVLLVFRAHRTTRDSALAAHDCLVQDGIRVVGTILNDWNPRKAAGYTPYSSYKSYKVG